MSNGLEIDQGRGAPQLTAVPAFRYYPAMTPFAPAGQSRRPRTAPRTALLGALLALFSAASASLPAAAPPSGQEFKPLAKHDPARPIAFRIVLEENAQVGDTSWSAKGEVRYALLPAWDGTPFSWSSFARLKAGERLPFYAKEIKGTGKARDGNGDYSWVETLRDGAYEFDAKNGSSYSKKDPYADATDAVLERTASGASLTFGWMIHTVAELGAGATSLGFTDDEASRLLTFRFSEDELRRAGSIVKTNQGTIHGDPEADITYPVDVRATLSFGPPPAAAKVTLAGCFTLGEGGRGQVTASGTPAGGAYSFRVIPPEAVKVQSQGAAATLIAGSPDRGTLFVEYTTPDGQVVEASHAVASVRIESVNGGAAVPEIPLYDIDGKKLPGVLEVPIKVLPADAADMLDFVADDPAVLSLANLGNAVALQGLRAGKTAIQARTSCGERFGPAVQVDVVNCDKATIAKLEEMMKIASDSWKASAKDFSAAMDSKEFQEASDKIATATAQLARKTAVAVIGSAAGYGETVTAGAKGVADVIGKLDAIADVLTDAVTGAGALDSGVDVAGLAAEFSGKQFAQTVFDTQDVVKAAYEFGQHLGNLKGQTDRMAEAAKWMDHWNKIMQDIARRQKICKKTETPQQEKKPPTEPEKPKPTPKSDPKKTTPSTTPTTPSTPTTTTTPGGTTPGTELPPTPPSETPRQVGLPYEKSDCGCGKTQAVGQSAAGFASISTGFGNLLDCVDRFRTTGLEPYAAALQEMPAVFEKLGAAAKTGGKALKEAAKTALPSVQSFSTRAKAFQTAGLTFNQSFQSCPESTKAAVSYLQSAKDYAKSAEGATPIEVRK